MGVRSEDALGKLLYNSGKIKESDVQTILQYALKKGLRFGEAAVKLRLIEQSDVDRALAAQIGGSYVADGQSDISREVIAAYSPSAPKVEALRSLRARLMLGSLGLTANAMAIVSSSSGDGRSFIAANLAVVFSQLGERTLLIDAHLQSSRLHEMFGIQNSEGLSSALAGRTAGHLKAVSIPRLRNLWLVPAGASPPNADELLAQDTFATICTALKSQFDVVLFDTPPGDSSAGADSIAGRCGKGLIVVRQNRTGFAAAKAFVERIKSHAEVVGCVLNEY